MRSDSACLFNLWKDTKTQKNSLHRFQHIVCDMFTPSTYGLRKRLHWISTKESLQSRINLILLFSISIRNNWSSLYLNHQVEISGQWLLVLFLGEQVSTSRINLQTIQFLSLNKSRTWHLVKNDSRLWDTRGARTSVPHLVWQMGCYLYQAQ